MTVGSIKLRRVRGGVNIRATGDVAVRLVASLGDMTRHALEQRRLRVRFADEGQDVLAWELAADGRISACGPYQAELFVGGKVHGIPTPGMELLFSFPGRRQLSVCAWHVEAVERLP
ncbi:MAG: hypothetical protein IAE86_06850 [Burkholderiaceae bacterium]|nr:hypothetical protein [Burkholderiaceae bacterium]